MDDFLRDDNVPFLNRVILLFGQPGTGKTVLIGDILRRLKDNVPYGIVFAPSDDSNSRYSIWFHPLLVYNNVDETALENIYDRQTISTQIYSRVNNVENLKVLFKKLNHNEQSSYSKKLKILKHETKKFLREKKNTIRNKTNLIEEIKKIKEEYEEKRIEIYKNAIKKYKPKLVSMDLTDEDELFTLTYISFNPSIVVILDDCADSIKKWKKNEKIHAFLFRGRHLKVTLIITIHNMTGFDPDLRTTAHIILLTSTQIAIRYVTNAANSFSSEDKKLALQKIEETFKFEEKENRNNYDEEEKNNKYNIPNNHKITKHTKIAYYMGKWWKINAFELNKNFCSKKVIQFLSGLPINQNGIVDKNNKMYEYFKPDN